MSVRPYVYNFPLANRTYENHSEFRIYFFLFYFAVKIYSQLGTAYKRILHSSILFYQFYSDNVFLLILDTQIKKHDLFNMLNTCIQFLIAIAIFHIFSMHLGLERLKYITIILIKHYHNYHNKLIIIISIFVYASFENQTKLLNRDNLRQYQQGSIRNLKSVNTQINTR